MVKCSVNKTESFYSISTNSSDVMVSGDIKKRVVWKEAWIQVTRSHSCICRLGRLL